MHDLSVMNIAWFLAAASLIAVTPGPGIFYVAGRTLVGGRAVGLASSYGTGIGGLFHVAAGAAGVSALVMASADAFLLLKLVGALYLVYLGVSAWRAADHELDMVVGPMDTAWTSFRQGIIVEATNPKTAAFFLAFIPQFVDVGRGHVALQFAALGIISVTLNTLVDVGVANGAAALRKHLSGRYGLLRRLRRASAAMLCALGVSLALARRT